MLLRDRGGNVANVVQNGCEGGAALRGIAVRCAAHLMEAEGGKGEKRTDGRGRVEGLVVSTTAGGKIKAAAGRDAEQKRSGGTHLVEKSQSFLNEVARDLEPPGREVRAPALE